MWNKQQQPTGTRRAAEYIHCGGGHVSQGRSDDWMLLPRIIENLEFCHASSPRARGVPCAAHTKGTRVGINL